MDLDGSTVEVAPSMPLVADGVAEFAVSIALKRRGGSPLSGLPVQLTATGTGHVVSASVPSSSQGLATLTITSTRAETKTLTVTVNPESDAIILPQHPTVTFVPGVAAKLAFTDEPATHCGHTGCTAGVNLPPVTVSILDRFDNVVSAAGSTVTLNLAQHPPSATLTGTLTQAAINGVATFPDLNLQQAETYSHTATASGVEGSCTSQGFVITAAAPSQLTFMAPIEDGTAGEDMGPVRVAVQDGFGNTVRTATHAITLQLGTVPTGVTLLVDPATVAAVDGVATFTSVIINQAGSPFSLAATSPGLAQGESNLFAVLSSAPSLLEFTLNNNGLATLSYDSVSLLAYSWSGKFINIDNSPVFITPEGETIKDGTAPSYSLDANSSTLTMTYQDAENRVVSKFTMSGQCRPRVPPH